MADAGDGGVGTGTAIWGLRKLFGYWQSGPVEQVASRALTDLHGAFNRTYWFILGDAYLRDTLAAIHDEVRRIRDGGDPPNAQRLSQAIRAHTPEKVPDDFDQAVEFLCRKLLIRAQEHAEFAGKVEAQAVTTVERQIREIQQQLGGVLPDPDDLVEQCRTLANERLEGFLEELRDVPGWDNLTHVKGVGEGANTGSAAPLNTHLGMIDYGCSLVIQGRAGIGKTTLLRAATTWINQENTSRSVGVFIPLREWQHQNDDLMTFTAARLGLGNEVTASHLRFLARHGRLCLILDGWNELNPAAAEAARSQLSDLFRSFRYLTVIVSSRDRPDIPSFPFSIAFEVRTLMREQRDRILSASVPEERRGELVAVLADHELDEITRTPFYLKRVIEATKRGQFYSNREQLIAASVEGIETADKSKAALKAATETHHRAYLIDLALAMFGHSLRLDLETARRSVVQTSESLADQFGAPPSPQNILEALRDHHLVVWTGGDADGGIEFPHQLFQEWFASLHFERLARQERTEGQVAALLDDVRWEEAVLFAVNRLAGTASNVCAGVIRICLKVEPLFAAALISRSGNQVWEVLCEEITEFAEAWHRAGTIDRGLAFMIASGRPEFAQKFRQALEHPDQQWRLRAGRLVAPFAPSSLGPDWPDWYLGLDEDRRTTFIDACTQGRSRPGLTMAAEAAALENPPKVVAEIISGLCFNNAEDLVREVMDDVSEDVWKMVLDGPFREDLLLMYPERRDGRGQDVVQRLAEMEHSPRRTAMIVELASTSSDDAANLVFAELETAPFSREDMNVERLFSTAINLDSAKTGAALVVRTVGGLGASYAWDEQVFELSPEARAIARDWIIANLGEDSHDGRVKFLMRQMSEDELAPIIDAWRHNDGASRRLLTNARLDPLALALAKLKPTDVQEACRLLDVIVWYEMNGIGGHRLPIGRDAAEALGAAVLAWLDLAGDDSVKRELKANVAMVLAGLGLVDHAPLVLEFLDQELGAICDDQSKIREWLRGRREGPDPRNNFKDSFRRAFSAMHCPTATEGMLARLNVVEFADQAAGLLMAYVKREDPDRWVIGDAMNVSRADFSRVADKRDQLRNEGPVAPHPYTDAVLDQAAAWKSGADDEKSQYLARALYGIAVRTNVGARHKEVLEGLRGKNDDYYLSSDACLLLALQGVEVPYDIAHQGYQDAVAAWKQNGHQDHGWWLVKSWIRVLLFSDNVQDAFQIIRTIFEGKAHVGVTRDILEALGDCPDPAAGEFLLELLANYPDQIGEHEWKSAVASLPLAEFSVIAVRLLEDAKYGPMLGGGYNDPLVAGFAERAVEDPAFCESVIDVCRARRMRAPAGFVYDMARDMAGTEQGERLLLAALDLLGDGRQHQYQAMQAIEARVVAHEPAGASTYYRVPSTAPELRQRLFEKAREGSKVAADLLTSIDEWRDELGRPLDEPRHPDLASGSAWPILEAPNGAQS